MADDNIPDWIENYGEKAVSYFEIITQTKKQEGRNY